MIHSAVPCFQMSELKVVNKSREGKVSGYHHLCVWGGNGNRLKY